MTETKPKVELPSVESTTDKCAGCTKTLNLLENHLKVMIKPERAVVVNQPVSEYEAIVRGEPRSPEEILASADVDEEEDTVSYLGWRSGYGEFVRVHNFDCLVQLADKREGKTVKLKFHRGEDEEGEIPVGSKESARTNK